MKTLLVIVNPRASSVSPAARDAVSPVLRRRFHVDFVNTQDRRHATELARQGAIDGYDAVVAFGGDGTINEVANGLAGTGTPIGCLPGGATNVYCRMLRIPHDLTAASERLVSALETRPPVALDLGRCNDRYFVFSAGVGLDASVVERVDRHPQWKARLGPWFFTAMALRTFFGEYVNAPPRLRCVGWGQGAHAGPEIHARPAALIEHGVSVFVQNGRPYTYLGSVPIDLAPDAGLQSRSLAGAVLEATRPAESFGVLWRALGTRRRADDHPRVRSFSAVTKLEVSSIDGPPVPVQVDGDHIGSERAVTFAVEPAALRALV
ncbi:MAG: hypothetical protein M3P40_13250 [Actinomycetota bacterium]|nr:hypothetical protein [Actinomycetota bacterium]